MSSMPYKKQAARLTSQVKADRKDDNGATLRALVVKVLSHPELFPDEFKTWLPRFLGRNVNFVVDQSQLPLVESRKLVGGTGNAAFVNSWVNFGGTNESAQYYIDPLGRVWLGGIVKSGTIPATIFTLPAGYRPEEAKVYAVASNGAFGICTVNPDGTVVATAGNNTYFSLSGISFRQFS